VIITAACSSASGIKPSDDGVEPMSVVLDITRDETPGTAKGSSNSPATDVEERDTDGRTRVPRQSVVTHRSRAPPGRRGRQAGNAFQFVPTESSGKPDPSARTLIRSHVMRGKNRRKNTRATESISGQAGADDFNADADARADASASTITITDAKPESECEDYRVRVPESEKGVLEHLLVLSKSPSALATVPLVEDVQGDDRARLFLCKIQTFYILSLALPSSPGPNGQSSGGLR
jgi:hypothetical protein